MPVGEATLGRIMDVLGRPIDEAGPIKTEERRAIHQVAPKFADLSPSVELLPTGIKVIDLVCPFAKGGKVGLFGSCSGGRHAMIYAAQRHDVDAVVDLWGGRVVMGAEELNAKTPVAPIDMTKGLACPVLGIFGNDDRAPSPEQVNEHEAALKAAGKNYEFHRYDGAGHGIFYWHRPLYRPEAAMDGWAKVWAFFSKYLAK